MLVFLLCDMLNIYYLELFIFRHARRSLNILCFYCWSIDMTCYNITMGWFRSFIFVFLVWASSHRLIEYPFYGRSIHSLKICGNLFWPKNCSFGCIIWLCYNDILLHLWELLLMVKYRRYFYKLRLNLVLIINITLFGFNRMHMFVFNTRLNLRLVLNV